VPRMLRPLLLLTALISLAAAAPALATVVGIQDDQLPIAQPDTVDARVAAVAGTGARVVRLDVFWDQVARARPANPKDPADPAYDFSRYDEILSALRDRGVRAILSIYRTPAWANGGKGVDRAPLRPGDFGSFAAALATRYSGHYLAADGAPLPRVRHYEIWNEPNLKRFFQPQFVGRRAVSPNRYASLVKAAYPAIHSVQRDAVVIAGAVGPTNRTRRPSVVGALTFLQEMRRLHVPMDAFSQHIYPAGAPAKTKDYPSFRSVPRTLLEMDKIKRGLPLYITETGYTVLSSPVRTTRVSERQQARNLTDLFTLLRNPRIPVAIWFNYQDNPDWPAGLLRANGSRRTAYGRFLLQARKGALPATLRFAI
jgi:cellulase (glycosyl hydrolase family 5)